MSSPLQWPPSSNLSSTSPSLSSDQHNGYQTQPIQQRTTIPQDTQPSLRPLQPQPYTPLSSNHRIHDSYIYPRSTFPQPIQPHPFQQSSEVNVSDIEHDSKRIRVSRACDGCRRKKIKCDNDGLGSTCKSCRLANTVCTFKDSAKKRGPPKGYIEILENRLKRMEKLLGGMAENKNRTLTLDNDDHDDNEQPTTSINTSPTQSNDITSIKNPDSSAMVKSTTPYGTSSETIIQNRHRSTEQTELHPRYIGDMSTLPFLAQKFNFEDSRFALPDGIKIRRFGQSLVIYEQGDNLNGRTPNQIVVEKLGILKPGEPVRDVDEWIFKVANITKTTSDRLMKVYFAYIHPGLPVVNKTLFLNQYRDLADDFPSAPLLNAMYGAATRYIETCQLFGDLKAVTDAFDEDVSDWQIPEGGSERFFDNLITYVRGRYSPSIAVIQALIIAQNHRASLDAKMTGSWLINGAAIRMAQDLGLHRSTETWQITEGEKETRRRVWWAVYIMDKWSAASTGRPQTIFDEDCDESYPNESASWEEVMDTASNVDDHQPRFPSLEKSVAQKAKGERIPIYQPFVQLIKLSEILGHVLQGLYTPRAKKYSAEHGSDAIVSYLDKALSDWRAALPPTLQISGTNLRKLDSRGRTPLLSMSGLMYLSYCTLLILLHRPFIEKEGGEKTKSSVSSLSICISAATRCVDVADSMHFRDFLLVSWNFAIYHVFTASLIHIHTASHAGSVVSDVAKSDLIKSVRVVKRLSNMSAAACQIHQVLLRLMKMGNISYDDPSSDDEMQDQKVQRISKESTKKKKTTTSVATVASTSSASSTSASSSSLSSPVTTSLQNSLNKNSNVEYEECTGVDHLKAGMSPRVSDVGRGQLPTRASSSPSTDPQFMANTLQPNEERINSASSTPTSLINGDWINGLYSSIQQGENQASIGNGNMQQESDPHSLRRFGLNMEQMFTPIDQMSITNNSPNALSMENSQQGNNYSTNGLSQNFLFGLSNIGFTAGSMQQQPSVHSNLQQNPSSLYPESSQQQQSGTNATVCNNYMIPIDMSFQSSSTTNNETISNQVPMVDHSLFRNRPDNPFWSVPSSIELDDWTAYLLPNQSVNGNNLGTDNIQIQQQEQQQQTWPSGWM